MGEDTTESPETLEPIELCFGDIVRAISPEGRMGATGVVVGLSGDTLYLDDLLAWDPEKGVGEIIHTGGTHYGPVKIIGHLDGVLPQIITALSELGSRFKVPPEQIEKFIEDAKTEAAKGPVMFTPAKPRTDEQWAEIDAQMRKEHPNFFKGAR